MWQGGDLGILVEEVTPQTSQKSRGTPEAYVYSVFSEPCIVVLLPFLLSVITEGSSRVS